MMELDAPCEQRIIIAFISGLLIGGVLVWAFSGTQDSKLSVQEQQIYDICVEKGGVPIIGQGYVSECVK